MDKNVDKEKYEFKEVNMLNGIPWPRLPEDIDTGKINVPLKEDYKLRSMDYLDTVEARPIFEEQARIIMENNIKSIIDVGCRIGIVNEILYENGYTDYQYMGFDTSPQPIEYATEVWQHCDNINYRVASMYDKESIAVDFDVDCIIWSGVLLYNPDNHMELFHDLSVDFYNAKHAIIQEPCKEQVPERFLKNMILNTIEESLWKYAEKYQSYSDTVIDAKIFSGRRRIAHIGFNTN